MNIIIADDNKAFREALIMFLETELNHTILSEHCNGLELLHCKQLPKADIILMDIEMPKLNGITTMYELQKINANIKVIAITDYFEKAYLEELIQSGFKGCVYKDSIFRNLEKAIIEVYKGSICFPDKIKLSDNYSIGKKTKHYFKIKRNKNTEQRQDF